MAKFRHICVKFLVSSHSFPFSQKHRTSFTRHRAHTQSHCVSSYKLFPRLNYIIMAYKPFIRGRDRPSVRPHRSAWLMFANLFNFLCTWTNLWKQNLLSKKWEILLMVFSDFCKTWTPFKSRRILPTLIFSPTWWLLLLLLFRRSCWSCGNGKDRDDEGYGPMPRKIRRRFQLLGPNGLPRLGKDLQRYINLQFIVNLPMSAYICLCLPMSAFVCLCLPMSAFVWWRGNLICTDLCIIYNS